VKRERPSVVARGSNVLPIALVVPLQGPTGIYGPSCLACAELAADELNQRNGINGRR